MAKFTKAIECLAQYFAIILCVSWIVAINGVCAKEGAETHRPPSILLANVLSPDIDPSLYLVSEKYDGVRAIWDGKFLKSRSGKLIAAPQWFIEKLPSTPLDGELWLARGKFDELSGTVRKVVPIDDEWRKIKYMIFELPDASGSFEERAKRMHEIAKETNWSQLVAVEQVRVSNRAELKRKFDAIVKAGAEGLMLHLADAPYITGRSDVLLKLKPQLDTEAQVLAHIPGKGKYVGMMGALKVKTKDGIVFKLGTGFSDEQRRNPPAIGAQVTYTYRDITLKGVPRFASFVRVREVL